MLKIFLMFTVLFFMLFVFHFSNSSACCFIFVARWKIGKNERFIFTTADGGGGGKVFPIPSTGGLPGEGITTSSSSMTGSSSFMMTTSSASAVFSFVSSSSSCVSSSSHYIYTIMRKMLLNC